MSTPFKPKGKLEVFILKVKTFFDWPNYICFENKKYYLAFEKFPLRRKVESGVEVYNTGFHFWDNNNDGFDTYSIAIYCFRVMFGIKKRYGFLDKYGCHCHK